MHLLRNFRARAMIVTLASAVTGISAGPGAAVEAFRPLTIDGSSVRWKPTSPLGVTVLRYAIATTDLRRPEAINCDHTRPPDTVVTRSRIAIDAFRAATAEAFARWQRIARLQFVEVMDQATADIVIGEQAEPIGHAFTNLSLGGAPRDLTRPIVHATICLNPQRRWKIGFDGDLTSYDLVHTLTHEIGHAIGLDHPSARGHVMSFRYDEMHRGLTTGDVLGARSIYGATDGWTSTDVGRDTARRAAPDAAHSDLGRGMSD